MVWVPRASPPTRPTTRKRVKWGGESAVWRWVNSEGVKIGIARGGKGERGKGKGGEGGEEVTVAPPVYDKMGRTQVRGLSMGVCASRNGVVCGATTAR